MSKCRLLGFRNQPAYLTLERCLSACVGKPVAQKSRDLLDAAFSRLSKRAYYRAVFQRWRFMPVLKSSMAADVLPESYIRLARIVQGSRTCVQILKTTGDSLYLPSTRVEETLHRMEPVLGFLNRECVHVLSSARG